jgi:hypothetical protein
MGGDEAQDILQLIWRIGVHLGRHAHLGETEPSEFQQSIVPGNALLEQGMNGPWQHLRRSDSLGIGFAETSSGTIHCPHSTARPMIL